MKRRVIRVGLRVALALSVLGLCLFTDCTLASKNPVIGPAVAEANAILRDPGTQWTVFVCAGVYFVAFAALRRGEGGGWRNEDGCLEQPAFWLTGLMGLAAVAYVRDYSEAAQSAQALTLLGAAVVGQGAGVWALRSPKSSLQSPKSTERTAVGALTFLLVIAAVSQTDAGHFFQYRGQARWSGPWDNPNTFGLLMGTGAVLALGLLVWRLRSKGQSPNAVCGGKAGGEPPTSNIQHPTSNRGRWVWRGLLLGAAGVMGIGLVRSYSRGAWVGTALGLAYLLLNAGRGKAESNKQKAETGSGKAGTLKAEMLKVGRHWVVAVICASVLVLGFWSFGHTERAVARRAYSVASANDFSWRNRVAAWESALQMMAERPWFGLGWNQPERVYSALYRPAKVDEGMAIQLNDYFMLGMTLGLPALLCFAMYVGLSLTRPLATDYRSLITAYGPLTTDYWLKTTCRAGAIVLLVGFWFDGGLFKLPTAATFWVLLELGRAGGHEIYEPHEND